MKNILLTTVFAFTIFSSIIAQEGNGFGIKGGVNYNANGDYFNSIGNAAEEPDGAIGYHIGVFGKVGTKLYFKPELVYTKTKSEYNNGDFDLQKLDAPLLVGIKILGPVNVFGGPSLQYILNSDFENATLGDVENDFSVGLNFGIGLSLNKLGIDLRYERGFSDNETTVVTNNNIISIDRLDIRPHQLILSLSYML